MQQQQRVYTLYMIIHRDPMCRPSGEVRLREDGKNPQQKRPVVFRLKETDWRHRESLYWSARWSGDQFLGTNKFRKVADNNPQKMISEQSQKSKK